MSTCVFGAAVTSPRNAYDLADQVLSVATVQMEKFSEEAQTSEELKALIDGLIEQALVFFDKYDIPGMGPMLEAIFKPAVRPSLEVLLHQAANWLVGLFFKEKKTT